jgi:hypothetical protein
LTKKETILQKLSITDYSDEFIKLVANLLNLESCQKKIKLNDYFKIDKELEKRKDIYKAILYIACVSGTSHDELPGKKIFFFEREFKSCEIWIDKKIILTNKN